jgi:glycosyltransferase involved in cell wall biosynthesis
MKDLVSIIIRGKNEEDWLGLCIRSIREQTYTNHEIIYVDNDSSDSSIDIAKYYKVAKIKEIKHFLPGEAINIGIKASKGIYIVIISAHCIPRDKNWLSALVQSIQPDKIAGVYGRQIPLPSTSPDDARDLLITFGDEDRIQIKDPFFHNANSIVKRSMWDKVNFDNCITNIEDRDWAKKILDLEFQIKYDSKACVYHYHGLHQHNNYESFRAVAVNNLIKTIDDSHNDIPDWFELENRICPIAFYGKSDDIAKEISRFKKNNTLTHRTMLFYYGSKDPNVEGLIFLRRKVSRRAPFYKFTKDILDLVSVRAGCNVEAISFVDVTYKKFLKNTYSQNKTKIFNGNLKFSSFALQDKGDIWVRNGQRISPLKEMHDPKTQFLRVAFGQGSILRASAIRMQKSNPSDGFVHTFNDINYLIRG